MNFENLKDVMVLNPGLGKYDLERLETEIGLSLPSDVKNLLTSADGLLLGNGLKLYSSAELGERNRTFETKRYAPGYLAVGDDSGGRAIVISIDDERVFIVDQGSMDPDDMEPLGSSLEEWILAGSPI